MSRKNYTRAGVEDAARLAALDDDVETWEQVEGRYKEMIVQKGVKDLEKLDDSCDRLGERLRTMKNPAISKDDLLEVVAWKFGKGKPRYALMQYLKANTEDDVNQISLDSFVMADKEDVRGAINEMSKLKGVGPATASALLSLYRPQLFSFMDDEIIECLYNGKRGYTLAIYLEVNQKCCDLATKLGEGWTPRRVGRALWTAARIKASGGEWKPEGETSKRKVLESKETNTSISSDTKKRKKRKV